MKKIITLVLTVVLFAILTSSYKSTQIMCPTNHPNYFYKKAGVKPFKKVNQLRCYKFD